MGQGWRRVSEAVRQKVGVLDTDRTFKTTANGRNEAMFREATDFAQHLRSMERDLRGISKQVDLQFTGLRNILISPLPRAYEMGQNGPVPLEEEPRPIGQNVHIDKIVGSAQDLKRRLETEVIQPIKEWMVAYRTIQDRMRQLESVRLELDSRRRTVGNMQGRFERMKTNVGSMGQNGTAELEQMEKAVIHKEEKMMRTSAQYQEMERMVYNSLFTLVRDTSVLREYTAAALQIIQECFAMAHSAYDATAGLEFSTSAANGFGVMPTTAVYGGGGGSDIKYDTQAATVAAERVKSSKSLIRQLSDRMKLTKPAAAPEYGSGHGGYDNDANERGPYDQVQYGFDAVQPSKAAMPAYYQQQHETDVHGGYQQQQQQRPGAAYVPSPSARYSAMPSPMQQQQQW